ncbi:hypothetical protein CFI10_00385 [Marinobacterium iners]|uniref:hypothetical protein n=1 Tax=Marinobacterium iners TaxID=48076 RepID=UPI001A8EF578|nr:hypothetical protein [Marinobacterium iners]QSR33472.1 hypothetical protein CFI10_00385 [Marinobacterium iners]
MLGAATAGEVTDSGKYYQWPIWVVVSVPVGVLLSYVGAALLLPRLELRRDQIGDNTYYLGFLFTLISLTVTLIQYSDNAEDDFIVSNFGVALAATVVGIFLRSLLSQMRKDVVGVEKEMHATLRDASMRLRSQMAVASENFGSLHRQMAQVTEESAVSIAQAHDALAKGLNDVVAERVRALDEVVKASSASVNKRTEHICEELERTTQELVNTVKAEQSALVNAASAAKRSISKFENITVDTSALSGIEDAIVQFSGSVNQKLNEVAKASSSDVEYLAKASLSVAQTAETIEESLADRLELAAQQTSAMEALAKRLEALEGGLIRRTEDIQMLEAQAQTIERLTDRLQHIENKLDGRVEAVTPVIAEGSTEGSSDIAFGMTAIRDDNR